MKPPDRRGLLSLLIDDGRPLITLTGLALAASGLFASLQAVTGHLLPHDEAFLGMFAADLAKLRDGRVLHFMIHDRIAFGGAIFGIGTLYLYLSVLLGRGQAWAWWTLLVSGVLGFATFLAYLGYGYLDTWHGVATLMLLPVFFTGLFRTRRLLRPPRGISVLRRPGVQWPWRSAAGMGRGLLLLTAACLMLGGVIIMMVGMTTVFVPQDLAFMDITPEQFGAINPRLIPLIAHDRAGFGGAVCCCGLTMLGCLWCGRPSPALWEAVLAAGAAGFGTAIGVHFPIGYTSFTHLAPAYLGAIWFITGLVLTWAPMHGPEGTTTVS